MFIAMAMNCRWQALRASPDSGRGPSPYKRFIAATARSTAERAPVQELWNVCQVSSG